MLRWYIAGLIAAVTIARLAAILHLSAHAPVGILSIGVGFALGATLSAIAAPQRVTGRTPLIVRTIALAVFAVLSEHSWLYADFRRQWHEARAKSAEVAMFRSEDPWSPAEYFARELTPAHAALWFVDASFIIGAAVVTVLLWRRLTSRQNKTPMARHAADP